MSATPGPAASAPRTPEAEDDAPSTLERRQVLLYAAASALGVCLGLAAPAVRPAAEVLLWPALVGLMFATFAQTPLARVRRAGRDRGWLISALVANFVLVPVLVACLVCLVGLAGTLLHGSEQDARALSLGLLLVLLVPCTDWFLTFVHLARGDRAAAAVITPVNLVVQVIALPAWLALLGAPWLLGVETPLVDPAVVLAGAGVVLLPLVAVTMLGSRLDTPMRGGVPLVSAGESGRAWLARWPVPALAVVVLLVGAARGPDVLKASGVLWLGALACVLYLAAAVLIGTVVADIADLSEEQRRSLVCTVGTRNSFVVLPMAVALPAGWEVAAAVIVVQSLVELVGMGVVVRWLRGGGQPA